MVRFTPDFFKGLVIPEILKSLNYHLNIFMSLSYIQVSSLEVVWEPGGRGQNNFQNIEIEDKLFVNDADKETGSLELLLWAKLSDWKDFELDISENL